MKETLYIGHNIFLNKKQRYDLYFGKKIKVIGTNTCCWMPKKQDCLEFFAEYSIYPKKRLNCSIKSNKKGYKIYINNPDMFSILDFFCINKKNKNLAVAKNLIDIKDGGKEWLFFKKEKNKTKYNVVHTIEIKKIEELMESIYMLPSK